MQVKLSQSWIPGPALSKVWIPTVRYDLNQRLSRSLSTCRFSLDLDMQLASSLGPFMMANAAEIIRYTSAGWTTTGITNFENMLTDVFYPRLNSENRCATSMKSLKL
jgi:hypothetical protein